MHHPAPSVFLIIIIICGFGGAQADATRAWKLAESHPAAKRNQLWAEDVRELAAELPKRHKNLFFNIKESEFRKAAADLEARVSKLSDAGVVCGMMRLVALAGDAHSAVAYHKLSPPFRNYPIELAWLPDGVFVVAAANEEIVGLRLLKIGGASAAGALERASAMFAHENEPYKMGQAPRMASTAEVLQFLEIVGDPERAQFAFESADGKPVAAELVPLKVGEKARMSTFLQKYKLPVPFRMSKQGYYWSSSLPGTDYIYIQYNVSADAPDLPFAKFAEKIGAFLATGKFSKVVIDLRGNGGGDSRVARPLIDLLKGNEQINRKGNLFILIGRSTFSSAQLNADEFRTETNAILVGSPTGQKPNHFGEVRSFRLKNSGVEIIYSTKYFETDKNDPPSMMPDVTIEATSKDVFAGRDPILEAVVTGAWEKIRK